MQFKTASVVAFLAVVAPVLGASVSDDLEQFTQKTDAIVKEFQGLEYEKLATQGTKALETTMSLSDLKAEKFEEWPNQPLSTADQESSCKKLGRFMTVTQNLGTEFTRKNDSFRKLDINRDAAGVLAKDMDITTEFARRLLNILPDCQQGANNMLGAISVTYGAGVEFLNRGIQQGDYIRFTG